MKVETTENIISFKVEPIYDTIYNKDSIPPNSEILADIIISDIKHYILESTRITQDIKESFMIFMNPIQSYYSNNIKNFIVNCLNPLNMIDRENSINKKKQFLVNQSAYITNYIITEFRNFIIMTNKSNNIKYDIYMSNIDEEIFDSICVLFGLDPNKIQR